MMEIVFSDSAGGSLKVAQHYGAGSYHSGCIGVIVCYEDGRQPTGEELAAQQAKAQQEAEARDRRAWEAATPLGGNSADIFPFSLGLSIGDISGDCLGEARLHDLLRLFDTCPEDVHSGLAQEVIRTSAERLEMIRTRAAAGEDIRIWYQDQPDDLCGLCWLLDRLKGTSARIPGRILLVKLPDWEQREDGTVRRADCTGDLTPGDWCRYLPLQKPAPEPLLQDWASDWQRLQSENAPLRAVLNGRLVSMPETLYVGFILRELAAMPEEFHEAQLIGRVLSFHGLGIGDAWIALRIEAMVQEGRLEALTQATGDDPVYHRVLRKKNL